MSTPPRRRRPVVPNTKSDGGGWLPTIAMGLGVIVAGLGIGALVAVFMQRGGGGNQLSMATPVAVVMRTPGTAHAPPPIAIATIEPPRTPRPSPSPATQATDSAAPAPTATATAKAVHAVATIRTPATAPARVARRVAEDATATPAPLVAVGTTALPTAAPTAATIPTAVAATAVAQPEVASAYDEHAAAVVRRYVDALIRGDEKAAYGALGGSGTLSEQAFLDPTARIVSIKVTRIDSSNASVGCEIATPKGNFYGTYHVTAASSGPYIAQHDYIKV